MKVSIIIGVFMFLAGSYSPVELTRVLVLIFRGYSISIPWYWPAEITAIWLGVLLQIAGLWILFSCRRAARGGVQIK